MACVLDIPGKDVPQCSRLMQIVSLKRNWPSKCSCQWSVSKKGAKCPGVRGLRFGRGTKKEGTAVSRFQLTLTAAGDGALTSKEDLGSTPSATVTPTLPFKVVDFSQILYHHLMSTIFIREFSKFTACYANSSQVSNDDFISNPKIWQK